MLGIKFRIAAYKAALPKLSLWPPFLLLMLFSLEQSTHILISRGLVGKTQTLDFWG